MSADVIVRLEYVEVVILGKQTRREHTADPGSDDGDFHFPHQSPESVFLKSLVGRPFAKA